MTSRYYDGVVFFHVCIYTPSVGASHFTAHAYGPGCITRNWVLYLGSIGMHRRLVEDGKLGSSTGKSLSRNRFNELA